MNRCGEHSSWIDLYLDDELGEDELEVFNRHITECPSCRVMLAERRRFLEQVRAARPLHRASPQFRAQMAALLSAVPARQREMTAVKVQQGGRSWPSWLWTEAIPALIICSLSIAGIMILWNFSMREARANALVDMAAKTHRQQLAGELPLQVRTNSPAEMSAWFASKVPFHFRLPTYHETAGQDQRCQLAGGRLVDFRGAHAAYLAYRMKAQTISLLITSASSSIASGGEKTVSKGLTFRAHRREELQVVTWSVHNLTYALVSGVDVPAGQSCTVCHGSTKDRHLIRNLNSGNETPKINRSMLQSDISTLRLASLQ